ncbi:MAG: aldolase/citrate lyase family protein, partial [Pseudomonadota bacterium]
MTLKMRSWLFAPGDSEKKMGKAMAGEADIALLDLEDSVTPENKPAARQMVAEALAEAGDRSQTWV